MWIAPVFLEAIATSPTFSPLHISALQSALFCLAFCFAEVQSVVPALHFLPGRFITQSFDVSLGERRLWGKEKDHCRVCFIFNALTSFFYSLTSVKATVILSLSLFL